MPEKPALRVSTKYLGSAPHAYSQSSWLRPYALPSEPTSSTSGFPTLHSIFQRRYPRKLLGALITHCSMSAPQHVDSYLHVVLKAHPILSQHYGLRDSSQWRQFPVPTSLSSLGGCQSALGPRGQCSNQPLLVSQPAGSGGLQLSGSLTSATQSLPNSNLHPSISTSSPETASWPQPFTVRGEA